MLDHGGTQSGYPLMLNNNGQAIQCGEFMDIVSQLHELRPLHHQARRATAPDGLHFQHPQARRVELPPSSLPSAIREIWRYSCSSGAWSRPERGGLLLDC